MIARRFGLVAAGAGWLHACGDTAPPVPARPAAVEVVTDLPATGLAGGSAGSFVVRVRGASGQPVPGAVVHFAPALGGVRMTPAADTTDAAGEAATAVVLSTSPGPNQVVALVPGVPDVRSATTMAAADIVLSLAMTPRIVRVGPAQGTFGMNAVARDRHGNVVSNGISWTSRNPALVAVTDGEGSAASLDVASRPGETWVVATAGGVRDSVRVAVLDASSPACSYLATPVELPVGGTVAFDAAGMACVRSGEAAEYVVAAHYNTAVAAALASVAIAAHGITPPPAASPDGPGQPVPIVPTERNGFEAGLRAREARHMPGRVSEARAWYDARARLRPLVSAPRVGDVTDVNVNAFEFCDEPTARPARVAALTAGTMVLADTTNPADGYSDAEYAAIAAIVDSLVIPVDTAAFGAPTDIDGNGRITILFTRAVNELTPRGSGSVVLGFFYSRDLLPGGGADGGCAGSNAGELFYVLVPDASGVVGDARSKSYVQGVVIATIAHELQHALEVSGDHSVVDQRTMAGLYKRIGRRSTSTAIAGYETVAAQEAGLQVRRELVASSAAAAAASRASDNSQS